MTAQADGVPAQADGELERLDRRMVTLAAAVGGAIAFLAALISVIVTAVSGAPLAATLATTLGIPLVIMVASTGIEYLRWRATRFRVTDQRLELEFQLVMTKRRSLSRDRIRTVNITANIAHRIFGLAKVVVGTGQHGSAGDAEITLDPVPVSRARQLRVDLLRREKAVEPEERHDGAIATLRWAWAAYAPLSFVTPAIAAAAVGGVVNVSGWFSRGGDDDLVDAVVGDLIRTAAVFGYAVVVVGALLAGAVGAALLFVEMWWDYRLDREEGGTLHVQRGLLTSRSVTIEERRLRGVELVEPLGIRMVGAARVDAVATGMRSANADKHTDHKTLLPAAPKRLAGEVAADVLREDVAPTAGARLIRHPQAALVRRLRWALAPVALAAVVLAVLEVLSGQRPAWFVADALTAGWVLVVLAIPLAIVVAVDAYRSLGHAITGRYLVARRGALRRSTVALQRSGIIGWTVRQSIFQRRVGVLTLEATTAAGSGAYQVPDVDEEEGIRFADAAVPGLLEPFLQLPCESP